MSRGRLAPLALGVALAWGLAPACTNNPYPDADAAHKVFYSAYSTPPKTLDPAVAYATTDHAITGPVYDTLLEYHYLKRPFTLIPSLAREVPVPRPLAGGRVGYRFQLRDGLLFHEDPCFALGQPGVRTRAVVAADVAFELMRIADPSVNSPVITTFARIVGFPEFSKRLAERREADPAFEEQRIDRQYEAVGGIEGVRVNGPLELEIVLSEPYPQILYWFAMEFTAPLPWEAIVYYDGQERPAFAEHPVGTGPFRVTRYDKRSRIVLERNPTWYGLRNPEARAPAAVYPSEGEPGDAEKGLLDPAYVGRPLPFLERVELRLENEAIPQFNKFVQGYYDMSAIIQESFDQVVRDDRLSPEMAERGMTLEKSVSPGVYYLGFNMDDAVVGGAAGERGRKLRQAMSLVVDIEEYTRIFTNGRGIPAQSPLPPGLFGYEADYRNPYRQVNAARAARLLREAGYPDGIDAKTGQPLRLTFDTADTSARGRLRYQFFVDAWKRLGIDVEIAATNYNQFREKVRKGAYQIFFWGWIADYPDPENFLFLLWTPMSQTASGGPNSANFSNERYDALFVEMRNRPNDARRLQLIGEMREILERERPWIELFHPEDYALIQGWVANVKPLGLPFSTLKYRDVDPEKRQALRAAWNQPVLWPAYALAGIAVLLVLPGIVTFFRERQ